MKKSREEWALWIFKFPSGWSVREKFSILRGQNPRKTQFFLSFTKVNKISETCNKSKEFLEMLSLETWIYNWKRSDLFSVLKF